MEIKNQLIPYHECIKVSSLRVKYGKNYNLEEWIKDPNHLYVGRKGRIFINDKPFCYVDSIWHNPYKVDKKEYDLKVSLKLYKEYILNSEDLKNKLKELEGKALGCFCEEDKECHAKILSRLYIEYVGKSEFINPSNCKAIKKDGSKCTNNVKEMSEFCGVHLSKNKDTKSIQNINNFVIIENKRGQIRVGRIVKGKNPSFENFKNIIVLTASSAYGELGPYVLKNNEGMIMENIWQFSKVYTKVPRTLQRYSRWDNTIVWEWDEQIHVDKKGELTEEYWNWRKVGMNNKYPVRYPVGQKHRRECLYCLWEGKKLDYIESRKEIYVKVYSELVKKGEKYQKLINMLNKGINLLIIEIDGPHQESIEYYKEKYDVGDNFIENDTVLATSENLDILLNDSLHPYGHGYVLASCLMESIK